MEKLKSVYFYLTLILLILAVLLFFTRKQIIEQLLPKVKKIEIDHISISNDSIHVSLFLELKNRLITSYQAEAIDLAISSDGALLIQYTNSHKALAPDSLNRAIINFGIPIKNLKNQANIHEGGDSILISIQGEITFSTEYGSFNILIDEQIPFQFPIQPEFSIEQVEFLGRGEEKGFFDFKLHLKVVNKGKKEFHFKNIQYHFIGENYIESEGKLSDFFIPAEKSMSYIIPVEIKVSHQMKLLYKVIFDKDEINYKIAVRGTIVSIAGYTKDIPASFTNRGTVELYNPKAKKVKVTGLLDRFRRK